MKPLLLGALFVLLLSLTGCTTVGENQLIVDKSTPSDGPADKCRLTLQAIPYYSTSIMDMAAHQYTYRRVKLLNSQTNEFAMLSLVREGRTDNATTDLSPGIYVLYSVVVDDGSPTRNNHGDWIPAIREVKLRQVIHIGSELAGYRAFYRFDPLSINDFTLQQIEAR